MGGYSHFEYLPGDYPMLKAWSEAHGHDLLPAKWLPADGILITLKGRPMLSVFMYFDQASPIAFVDNVVSEPGHSNEEVRGAWVYACKVPIGDLAIDHRVEVIVGRCPPALARQCAPLGWIIDETPLISIACLV